ncbi:hemolysin family protein [Francisella frigiditurris]|uniref:CBS domain protein n=1 Tax=Francisella frigiditurris TaxID=1542390 RepID=A0A1J0KW30_9GAMM|nr:hemolysin family protein [Francisella frigiditurris]APC97977.1 CBS domain protein [Francisella frigiditurris]
MIEYDNLFFILLAFGFVLLNAFFVVSEFAMVKLRHSRAEVIKDKKGLQGRILYKVHNNLDSYLSVCQLGITLASLGLGWVGEPAFAELLEPVLAGFGITSRELVKFVSFLAGFSIISFLHIVIGELMPKSMAIRQAERWSLFTSVPLYVFYWIMFPFIWVLNTSANLLLKLFRLNIVPEGEHGYTAEEIKLILKSSHLREPLKEEHRVMLLRMMEFSRLQAIDATRPLDEMVSLNFDSSIEDKLKVIQESLYTRYPVYQGNKENIIGILHTKDILCALGKGDDYQVYKENLRPIVKVSHHAPLIELLNKFRQGKPHFALVYNKDSLIGFITLDNLLTILIGKMRDEFHFVKEPWVTLSSNVFLINTKSPVYAIEKLAEVDFSDYVADSVQDLLKQVLPVPHKVGDTWSQPAFDLRVNKVKNKYAKEVILEIKNLDA